VSGNDFCGYDRLFLEGKWPVYCLIDSVVFREADVARDPDESDLGDN